MNVLRAIDLPWGMSSDDREAVSLRYGNIARRPAKTRLHFHHPGTGRRHLVQFALLDDNVTVLLILEAFDQLGTGDGPVLEASRTIEMPASLRSDGVRVHSGMPFGGMSVQLRRNPQ